MARAVSPAIDVELDLLSRALADAAGQVGLLRYQTTFFDQGEDAEHRAHAARIAASLDEALGRVERRCPQTTRRHAQVAAMERSFDGFPFDLRTGQQPNERDTAPERTSDGDFILYHGSSPAGAERIIADRELLPDDLGVVGVTTTPGAAQTFAAMKGGEVLRLVLDAGWLAQQSVMREVGGSGCNQFLVQSPDTTVRMERRWAGIPSAAVKAAAVHVFE